MTETIEKWLETTARASKRCARRFLPLMALPLVLAACGDDDDIVDVPDQATASVYLTDAPGDVDSVWVQVNDVVLVGADGNTSLLDESTELINLTDLQDEATALATDVEVEAGTYTQVRFVLNGAVLLTAGGDVYSYGDVTPPGELEVTGDLNCPSCSQSGLKVAFPGGVEISEGEDAGLLLDFDVSQSFGRQAGASGMWVMHPVIIGVAADPGAIEDDGTESVISGTVALDTDVTIPTCAGEERTLEDFVPVATATTLTDDEGLPLAFTGETAADGAFDIEVLGVDTWTLGFEGETEFETDNLVWTAEVAPTEAVIEGDNDSVEDVAYTVTDVTCEASS